MSSSAASTARLHRASRMVASGALALALLALATACKDTVAVGHEAIPVGGQAAIGPASGSGAPMGGTAPIADTGTTTRAGASATGADAGPNVTGPDAGFDGGERGGSEGECDSSAQCRDRDADPFCSGGECVECIGDTACETDEVCMDHECCTPSPIFPGECS